MAYALPAHSSSTLQPFDVSLFSQFKQNLNEEISSVVLPDSRDQIDMFQFCALIRVAHQKSFTSDDKISSFRRSGPWPLDADKFIRVPRAADTNNKKELVGVDEMLTMLEHKRSLARRELIGAKVSIDST